MKKLSMGSFFLLVGVLVGCGKPGAEAPTPSPQAGRSPWVAKQGQPQGSLKLDLKGEALTKFDESFVKYSNQMKQPAVKQALAPLDKALVSAKNRQQIDQAAAKLLTELRTNPDLSAVNSSINQIAAILRARLAHIHPQATLTLIDPDTDGLELGFVNPDGSRVLLVVEAFRVPNPPVGVSPFIYVIIGFTNN